MESAESLILQTLLESGENHVTGSRLAELLGVSRVTVWSHMENLRRDGFVLKAVRNKGYRLVHLPERLSEAYLRFLLPDLAGNDRLVLFPETGSTNQDAERLLAEGREGPFVVLARRQTRGRGRLGRQWHSDDDANLYASFAFRPLATPERMRDFTLWIGVAVCQCLERETGLRPGLKWPNDLWHDGRKMGGILTEAKVNSDQILQLVLGIGLNVNSSPATWGAPLCREATSLRQALGRSIDINRFTAALIRSVMTAYRAFLDGDHKRSFHDLWEVYDQLKGKEVTVHRGNESFSGLADGIDDQGRLKVTRSSGETVFLNAGDVSLRPQSGTGSA